ncbi:hypothetical protein GCK72_013269 [Caenorhabditis remanei]|uniref:Uncharacterized protein n=1 Tax=Caenorhabditis remanei TaxID=31234 RepID=A0A6A5GQL0_CAERE|nr:hypothetical protein GCK72_013269 [Caenorhabditis remanei]KAF1756815.1 hypothetical protein GCK72_013269 [Caenorhabditis remanei]
MSTNQLLQQRGFHLQNTSQAVNFSSSTGECSQSVKALRKSSTIVCSFAPDDLNTSYTEYSSSDSYTGRQQGSRSLNNSRSQEGQLRTSEAATTEYKRHQDQHLQEATGSEVQKKFRLNNVICNCQQLLKTAGRYFYQPKTSILFINMNKRRIGVESCQICRRFLQEDAQRRFTEENPMVRLQWSLRQEDLANSRHQEVYQQLQEKLSDDVYKPSCLEIVKSSLNFNRSPLICRYQLKQKEKKISTKGFNPSSWFNVTSLPAEVLRLLYALLLGINQFHTRRRRNKKLEEEAEPKIKKSVNLLRTRGSWTSKGVKPSETSLHKSHCLGHETAGHQEKSSRK